MSGGLEYGIRISVEQNCLLRETGSSSNPSLLFVPGFGDNGTMYLPLFSTFLVEKFHLIALDLPGTGGSPSNRNINTIEEYGQLIGQIISERELDRVGLVGHSIASPMCVAATHHCLVAGLFSIEGNLTTEDAYFSGRAGRFGSADEFWTSFKADIRLLGADAPILSRYYGACLFADAETLWRLGRDAGKISEGNGPGHAFLKAKAKTHYFWSANNTPEETARFIAENDITNSTYDGSHWPSIDRADATASALSDFFSQCF